MDALRILLDVLTDALKQAVPEVEGRVYLRRSLPRQIKDVPFLNLSVGSESIDEQDEAPLTMRRTRSIDITAVVKGDAEEAYDRALTLRERVIAIMREIQMIPGESDGDPCLVDEITPSGESEIELIANGDKYFTAVTLSYDAVYVTEDGSLGEVGPGVPEFNVLTALRKAVANWTARRGVQALSAVDRIKYEETGNEHDSHSEKPEADGSDARDRRRARRRQGLRG